MDDALRALEMEALAGDAQAYRSLGRALIRAGRFREAKSAFRKYMDSNPHFTPEEYKCFIKETSGIDTAFQPLPPFAEYIIIDPTLMTYAEEVHRLRRDRSAVYQPLAVILGKKGKPKTVKRLFTFEENIRARVEDYNTLTDSQGNPRTSKQRLALFREWVSSCTGVAYKANSTKFRIDPMCRQLIGIQKGFNRGFLEIPYESADGIELDSTEGIYSNDSGYNLGYRPLTNVDGVLNHKGWRVAVQDKGLLKESAEIYFSLRESGMGFWVIENPDKDQLRTLDLGSLDDDSGADASWGLYGVALSLRVVHK